MANIHDCIQRAVDAGELDRSRGIEARSQFDQLVSRYDTIMPRWQAEASAAADLKEATRRAGRARTHAVVNQLQAMRRISAAIEAAEDPGLVIRNMLEFSEGSGYRGESVRSLQEAITRSVNADIARVLREHGRNLAGNVRKAAQFENLVRELHGEATGDVAAVQLAGSIRAAQERLRVMFNAHGGDIGKLDHYGVAHSHDTARLRAAGRDAWIASVDGRLDWAKIIDRTTGKPFAAEGRAPAAARRFEFLSEVYDGIVTQGWNHKSPSLAMGGKALYNQRAEARILHFRSGSDWIAYNRDFGSSDPFSALVGGLHAMARDIAMMRVLGPNPRLGLEFARQVGVRRANIRKDAKLEARVNSMAHLAGAMLAHVDGSANVPVNEGWASFFGGTRKILTSIQLGSAPLSSVTDLATISMASRMIGLNPANVLGRTVKLIGSAATRENAARMGYVADTLANAGSAAARFVGETYAPEIAERLSQFTMRASGLSFWTDMNRIAFQMEFAGYLADNSARGWDAIDGPLRRLLEARGITPADWDALRAPAPFQEAGGATFLTPWHWLEVQTELPRAEAEGLAMRLQMAVEEQLEYAVPSATLEGRARLQGDAPPGTFAGELLRSSLMYKSFALSLTLGQIRRFNAIPTGIGRATYAAKISAGLLVLGAVAVQLKEFAKGRDPRPMDEGKFWMGALFQGGGLGIFGDFFSSETSRTGGGLAETLAGPVVGFASDVLRPVASNITRAVQGQDTMLGRDAANFVRYNTPVGSSLWYTRLAFDRLVSDQLQLMLDPEAETQFRRQERQRARDYGNTTWWDRGRLAPSRAPDLSTIGGSQ